MDKASQVLAQGPPSGVPRSYRTIADHSGVPRSTLHNRSHVRRSIEEKAESQQYLTPFEEKAVVDFVLKMAELGTPVRMMYIPSIAFSSTRHRPLSKRPPKPPSKNWVKALEKRRPELVARRALPRTVPRTLSSATASQQPVALACCLFRQRSC